MPIQSINIPTSGLRNAQRNLATVGHNMANVSTEGFSRQRVNQGTFGYQNIGRQSAAIMQVGMGSDILGIQQLRNTFLDKQFRAEIGRANFYDNLHRAAFDIEVSMGELTNTSSGVAVTRLLWTTIQELSLNPSGIDARANFVSGATSYLNRMNDTARRLREQQNVLNDEVKVMVDQANELIHRINQLNSLISGAEATGQAANDFRDSRALAMDQLAGLLDVTFNTNPRNGDVEIVTNGLTLLSGGVVNPIGLRFTEPGSSFVEPVVGHNLQPGQILSFDPTFRNANSLLRFDRPPLGFERPGSIMGTIMARGVISTANHTSQQSTLPRYNAAGEPDSAGLFLADGTELTPEEMARSVGIWERRMDFHSDHTLIPRTLRHLDTKFNHTVAMLNEFFTNGEASSDPATWGNMDEDDRLFGIGGVASIPIFVLRDGAADIGTHLRAGNTINDNTMQYSLGNVIINPLLLTPQGFNYIGTMTNTVDTDSNHSILNLLGAWHSNTLSVDGTTPMNIDDFYNWMVTELSTETARLRNMAETQAFIATEIDSDRHRSFGVSLDEEMTDMIRFQHSFNAASRVVNIIDSMIETILRL